MVMMSSCGGEAVESWELPGSCRQCRHNAVAFVALSLGLLAFVHAVIRMLQQNSLSRQALSINGRCSNGNISNGKDGDTKDVARTRRASSSELRMWRRYAMYAMAATASALDTIAILLLMYRPSIGGSGGDTRASIVLLSFALGFKVVVISLYTLTLGGVLPARNLSSLQRLLSRSIVGTAAVALTLPVVALVSLACSMSLAVSFAFLVTSLCVLSLSAAIGVVHNGAIDRRCTEMARWHTKDMLLKSTAESTKEEQEVLYELTKAAVFRKSVYSWYRMKLIAVSLACAIAVVLPLVAPTHIICSVSRGQYAHLTLMSSVSILLNAFLVNIMWMARPVSMSVHQSGHTSSSAATASSTSSSSISRHSRGRRQDAFRHLDMPVMWSPRYEDTAHLSDATDALGRYFRGTPSMLDEASLTRKVWETGRLTLFFSSPFGGFESERTQFNTIYLPLLREMCEQRLVRFEVVDLRWGITKEQAADNRTIEVCMREVQEADIFVGMIGARYGSSTRQEHNRHWIEGGIEIAKDEFPILQTDNCRRASITEMEFRYGCLENLGWKPSYFMFRDEAYDYKCIMASNRDAEYKYKVECADSEVALNALKSEIRELASINKVALYDGYPDPMSAASRLAAVLEGFLLRVLPPQARRLTELKGVLDRSSLSIAHGCGYGAGFAGTKTLARLSGMESPMGVPRKGGSNVAADSDAAEAERVIKGQPSKDYQSEYILTKADTYEFPRDNEDAQRLFSDIEALTHRGRADEAHNSNAMSKGSNAKEDNAPAEEDGGELGESAKESNAAGSGGNGDGGSNSSRRSGSKSARRNNSHGSHSSRQASAQTFRGRIMASFYSPTSVRDRGVPAVPPRNAPGDCSSSSVDEDISVVRARIPRLSWVFGEAGVGKSSFLMNMVFRLFFGGLSARRTCEFVYFFHTKRATFAEVRAQLVSMLSTRAHGKDAASRRGPSCSSTASAANGGEEGGGDDTDDLEWALRKWLGRHPGIDLIIIIDGLDMITSKNVLRETWILLDALLSASESSDRVRILVSSRRPMTRECMSATERTRRAHLIFKSSATLQLCVRYVHIRPISTPEKKAIIARKASRARKTMDESIEDMLCLSQATKNPRYLTILMDELLNFGSFDKLHAFAASLMRARDATEILSFQMDRLEAGFNIFLGGIVQKILLTLLEYSDTNPLNLHELCLIVADAFPEPPFHYIRYITRLVLSSSTHILRKEADVYFVSEPARDLLVLYYVYDHIYETTLMEFPQALSESYVGAHGYVIAGLIRCCLHIVDVVLPWFGRRQQRQGRASMVMKSNRFSRIAPIVSHRPSSMGMDTGVTRTFGSGVMDNRGSISRLSYTVDDQLMSTRDVDGKRSWFGRSETWRSLADRTTWERDAFDELNELGSSVDEELGRMNGGKSIAKTTGNVESGYSSGDGPVGAISS